MIIIGVTSKNVDKLSPTLNAARVVWSGKEVVVFGDKSASKINEQPVGDQEIILGAENRITSFKSDQTRKVDYIVSYENGIRSVEILGEQRWFDFVWVIVEDCKSGKRAYACGQGVQFPTELVERALGMGFDKTTVGSVIASHTGSTNSSDPHSILTGGLVRRSELLEIARMTALSQLVDL